MKPSTWTGWATLTLLHHARTTLFQLTLETRTALGSGEGEAAPSLDREHGRARQRVANLTAELASVAGEIGRRVAQ